MASADSIQGLKQTCFAPCGGQVRRWLLLDGLTLPNRSDGSTVEQEVRDGQRFDSSQPVSCRTAELCAQLHQELAKNVGSHQRRLGVPDRQGSPERVAQRLLDNWLVTSAHEQGAKAFPILRELDAQAPP